MAETRHHVGTATWAGCRGSALVARGLRAGRPGWHNAVLARVGPPIRDPHPDHTPIGQVCDNGLRAEGRRPMRRGMKSLLS